MMRLFALILLVAAIATAFTSPQPRGRLSCAQQPRFMAELGKKEDAPALQTIDETVPPPLEDTPKNLVKNMNTGELKEVKWRDPDMQANTSFEMSW